MVFDVFDFLQKTNKRIQLYYYDTSSRLVFIRFLEEIKDTKKTFRNYLTFKLDVDLHERVIFAEHFMNRLSLRCQSSKSTEFTKKLTFLRTE
jgi:hypothetical protein